MGQTEEEASGRAGRECGGPTDRHDKLIFAFRSLRTRLKGWSSR